MAPLNKPLPSNGAVTILLTHAVHHRFMLILSQCNLLQFLHLFPNAGRSCGLSRHVHCMLSFSVSQSSRLCLRFHFRALFRVSAHPYISLSLLWLTSFAWQILIPFSRTNFASCSSLQALPQAAIAREDLARVHSWSCSFGSAMWGQTFLFVPSIWKPFVFLFSL